MNPQSPHKLRMNVSDPSQPTKVCANGIHRQNTIQVAEQPLDGTHRRWVQLLLQMFCKPN